MGRKIIETKAKNVIIVKPNIIKLHTHGRIYKVVSQHKKEQQAHTSCVQMFDAGYTCRVINVAKNSFWVIRKYDPKYKYHDTTQKRTGKRNL